MPATYFRYQLSPVASATLLFPSIFTRPESALISKNSGPSAGISWNIIRPAEVPWVTLIARESTGVALLAAKAVESNVIMKNTLRSFMNRFCLQSNIKNMTKPNKN